MLSSQLFEIKNKKHFEVGRTERLPPKNVNKIGCAANYLTAGEKVMSDGGERSLTYLSLSHMKLTSWPTSSGCAARANQKHICLVIVAS
jgi:hypothetical protein